jgi:hypothetical protein
VGWQWLQQFFAIEDKGRVNKDVFFAVLLLLSSSSSSPPPLLFFMEILLFILLFAEDVSLIQFPFFSLSFFLFSS